MSTHDDRLGRLRMAAASAWFCVSFGVGPVFGGEPILRASLEPAEVFVTQPIRLRISVLVPNWFTEAPQFPELDLPNAIVRSPANSRFNMSEQIGQESYVGVGQDYMIYPQEPGRFSLPQASITFAFAAEPPASSPPMILTIPPAVFSALLPPGAADLRDFLVAEAVEVIQELSRPVDELKVGDAFSRTVVLMAEGVPGMLLQPTTFAATDGLSVYVDEPIVEDIAGSRGKPLIGRRVDRATYVMERAGTYTLPEMRFQWWNPVSATQEQTILAPTSFTVSPNTALAPGRENAVNRKEVSTVVWWGLAALVLAIVGFGIGWHRRNDMLRAAWSQRRQRRFESEAAHFTRFEAAAQKGDAHEAYSALILWLDRALCTGEPVATLRGFIAVSEDPALDKALADLSAVAFGSDPSVRWSGVELARQVRAARKRLRKRRRRPSGSSLVPLSPATGSFS